MICKSGEDFHFDEIHWIIGAQYKYKDKYFRGLVNGKYIAFHRYIYIKHKGVINKGNVIHHKDFNPLNNSIENLESLSTSEHMKLHGKCFTDSHKEWIRIGKVGCKNPMFGKSGEDSPTYKYKDGDVWQIPSGPWKTKTGGKIKLIKKSEYHLYKEINLKGETYHFIMG